MPSDNHYARREEIGRNTIASFFCTTIIASSLLVGLVAKAKEPDPAPRGLAATSGLVLATIVPPKRILLQAPNKWRYEIEKDAEGNAIFDYIPVCWLEKPQTKNKIPQDVQIRRKKERHEGSQIDLFFLPTPKEEFVMMEVAEGPDNRLWAKNVWPIDELKKIDTVAVCKNEEAGYQDVLALRKLATTTEKLRTLSEITSHNHFKASVVVVLESRKYRELTRDQYQSLYQFLAEIGKSPESPAYVQKFVKLWLTRMPKPESSRQEQPNEGR